MFAFPGQVGGRARGQEKGRSDYPASTDEESLFFALFTCVVLTQASM